MILNETIRKEMIKDLKKGNIEIVIKVLENLKILKGGLIEK
jgi:hypothetical protein